MSFCARPRCSWFPASKQLNTDAESRSSQRVEEAPRSRHSATSGCWTDGGAWKADWRWRAGTSMELGRRTKTSSPTAEKMTTPNKQGNKRRRATQWRPIPRCCFRFGKLLSRAPAKFGFVENRQSGWFGVNVQVAFLKKEEYILRPTKSYAWIVAKHKNDIIKPSCLIKMTGQHCPNRLMSMTKWKNVTKREAIFVLLKPPTDDLDVNFHANCSCKTVQVISELK